MTDKKFTDEDIIKALECCINGACWCEMCPIGCDEGCIIELCQNALSLINCQKAEIERLITLNSQLEAKVFDTRKEADILKSTITHKEEEAYNKGYNDALKDVEELLLGKKAEAMKKE